MPPRDIIHASVVNALVKNGWTVTADPFVIEFDDLTLFADLAAERAIAAQREDEKIAVEIKSFLGVSQIRDFEQAIGQYDLYRSILQAVEPDRQLYLAVSSEVFETFFERPSIQFVVTRLDLAILVVDVKSEVVIKWLR